MRILFVDRHTKVGGLNTYLRSLVPSLNRLGHECYLVSRRGPFWGATRSLFAQAAWHPPLEGWSTQVIARALRAWKADLVVAQTTTCAREAEPACRSLGVPLVMHIHSMTNLKDAGAGLDYASRIVVMNPSNAEFMRRRFPQVAERLYVSRLPVDLDSHPAEAPREGAGFRVLYCARLSRSKGHQGFAALQAVSLLAGEIPELSVTLLGGRGSRLTAARKEARELNRQAGRRATSAYPVVLDPRPFMAEADLVVGAGYVALEGLAMNRRVVGLGVLGLYGEVTEENLPEALAWNFGDQHAEQTEVTPELVAKTFLDAYHHHQREGQITWGHESLRRYNDPQEIARELTELYNSVLNRPAGT
ncbi:glycosyltransferase family 4 protein [bacterium]|nr:glycosyltransferase family 4 protein [bacterium]